MPKIERVAEVVWEGNIARGSGRISGATGAFTDLPYSLPTRIGQAEGKTSPEELLAAAHAGCFAMALAGELTAAGTPPERLDVSCKIVMDEIEGAGHQIVASHITIKGTDADDEVIDRADAECPFSTLLRKVGAELTITRA